ncbi:lanthionine synthetase LanC family protein [Promicromonospora sp. NPDC057488]|uniref:lanthionine synthetase LanC family protein n=1 Tax=Promicromonospora sp. NPDC057488 TaxID=3346147 RepID=UPI00366BD3DC
MIDSLLAVTSVPLDDSARASLFRGVPALTFVMDSTGAAGRMRWARQLTELDELLIALTGRRLFDAAARSRNGDAASSDEFDLMTGLTGLALVLLRRTVHARGELGGQHAEALNEMLSRVLTYLVHRTRDRVLDDVLVPGWWSKPRRGTSVPVPGKRRADAAWGYADFGVALGGAGILSLLAAASQARCTVPGQDAAIRQITGWYVRWRQHARGGVVWWPHRLTLEELRTGRTQQHPPTPTWAHGTPGIGRALQMAAIALGDPLGRRAAEGAIASCLTRSQLDSLTEPDLYAGTGGMYLTVLRAARDAEDFAPLNARASLLTHRVGAAADAVSRTSRTLPEPDDREFMYGKFGTRLVFQALRSRAAPVSGVDAVLATGWVE